MNGTTWSLLQNCPLKILHIDFEIDRYDFIQVIELWEGSHSLINRTGVSFLRCFLNRYFGGLVFQEGKEVLPFNWYIEQN